MSGMEGPDSLPPGHRHQLARRRSDDILLYGDGMFSPLGLPSETTFFSKDWLMETDVVSDKRNRLEMRERRQLKKMVTDQAQHAVLGPPKPLYDFCGASDSWEDFDEVCCRPPTACLPGERDALGVLVLGFSKGSGASRLRFVHYLRQLPQHCSVVCPLGPDPSPRADVLWPLVCDAPD